MALLTGKTHTTDAGEVYYRTNVFEPGRQTLVYLHGAAADGRSFIGKYSAYEYLMRMALQ